MKAIVYPEVPPQASVISPILQFLGIQVDGHNPNSIENADIYIVWNGATTIRKYPNKNAINYNCLDISKNTVSKAYEEVFNTSLLINPTEYTGLCVQKSDENAIHDGKILSCPVRNIDINYVYQRVVNNLVTFDLVEDIRVPIIGNSIPFVYRKLRHVDARFSNVNLSTELLKVDEVLTPLQIEKILLISNLLSLDFGEMDVLIDRDTTLPFVVDVNKTPSGPPNGLSKESHHLAIKLLAEEFKKTFIDCNYKIKQLSHLNKDTQVTEKKINYDKIATLDSFESRDVLNHCSALFTPHGLNESFLLRRVLKQLGVQTTQDIDDSFAFAIYNNGSLKGRLREQVVDRLSEKLVLNFGCLDFTRYSVDESWCLAGGSSIAIDINSYSNKFCEISNISSSSNIKIHNNNNNINFSLESFYFKNLIDHENERFRIIVVGRSISCVLCQNLTLNTLAECKISMPNNMAEIVYRFLSIVKLDFGVLDVAVSKVDDKIYLLHANPTPMRACNNEIIEAEIVSILCSSFKEHILSRFYAVQD